MMNIDVEQAIIKRLKAVSLATNAGRIVALYIAGMPEKRVKSHIKQRTFSGANALDKILHPDTPPAREAWGRGKDICIAAGLPIRRVNWTDRPNENLIDINQSIQMKNINSATIYYLPTKSDIEFAESQLRKSSDEVIGMKDVLDQIEVNLNNTEKTLKAEWREITSKNIDIWFGWKK